MKHRKKVWHRRLLSLMLTIILIIPQSLVSLAAETESSALPEETVLQETEAENTAAENAPAAVEAEPLSEEQAGNAEPVPGEAEAAFDKALKELLADPALGEEEKNEKIARLKEAYAAGADHVEIQASGGNKVANEWLEFVVLSSGENIGRYTIGTVEGNPNYSSDNNQKLLYGHPSPWSSETLLKLEKNGVTEEVYFKADRVRYDYSGRTIYADMELDRYGLVVTQKLEFVRSETTGRYDTVKISYSLTNVGSGNIKAGVRIMMDTMLASHDDAPFKVPGSGNLTKSREYSGSAIQQTYQVYDKFDNPTTMATGTLWQAGDRKPNKVQFCSWGGIHGSSWSYQDAGNFTFGDSAVGIYFDPTELSAGASTSVCTYYGTALNFTQGNGNGAIDVSKPIGSGQFVFYVSDAADGKPVEGAKVTLEDGGVEAVTDASGRAVFSNAPKKSGRTENYKTFRVTKEGYKDRSFSKDFRDGVAAYGLVKKSNSNVPIVDKVSTRCSTAKYNNVDLLSKEIYFNSNPTEIVPGGTGANKNFDTMELHVYADNGNSNVYRLIQDGEVKMQNNTGVFDIHVIKKDALGKEFPMGRIDQLDEGKKVYLQVVGPDGSETQPMLLGIKISQPSSYSSTLLDKVKFSGKIKLDLPNEDIMKILLGDNDYEAGMLDDLPIEIEYDQDGKVKVAINKDKKKDWSSIKQDYQKAVMDRSMAARAFGGSPQSFGAGKANIAVNFCGYGEGYINNGQLNVNVGIVATASAGASYTHTFFVGWVPLYLKVGADLKVDGTFEAAIVKDAKLTMKVTQGKFEPSVALYAELGAGVEGLLSGGVQGRGTLKYSHDFVNDHRTITLQAKASVEVHLVLFHKSIEIAQKTWGLYDNYAPDRSYASEVEDSGLYDLDTYTVTDRDYLDLVPVGDPDYSKDVISGIYPDARPVMVKAGDNLFRFWIHDAGEGRNELDRTELVFSKYNSGKKTWDDPKPVYNDGHADYNFDVATDGASLYVTWQHSRKSYTTGNTDSSETITDMLKNSDVWFAKIAADGTVSAPENLTNTVDDADKGDLLPKIALNASNPTVVWYVNTENAVIADGKQKADDLGATSICSKTWNGSAWGDKETRAVTSPMLTSFDTGLLDGNVAVAFTVDKDNNYNTTTDRELYLVKNVDAAGEAEILQASGNIDADENPQFASVGGENKLFWYANNNYHYTDGTVSGNVFTESSPAPENISPSFSILTGTKPAIAYVAYSGVEEGKKAVYLTEYSGGAWGIPYEWKIIDASGLSNDPILSSLTGYDDGTEYHVSYQLLSYKEDGSLEKSDLQIVTGDERNGLQLDWIDYDMNETESGKTLKMSFGLTNTGTKEISSVTATAGSKETEITLSPPLKPGESRELNDQDITLPTFSAEGEIDFALKSGSKTSNKETLHAGYVDVAVELEERTVIGAMDYIPIRVSNLSRSAGAKNVNLKVIADDEESGAIIFENQLDTLSANSAVTLLCPLTNLEGSKAGYVRLVTSSKELNELNNRDMIVIDGETPDLTGARYFNIQSENNERGTVTASVSGNDVTTGIACEPGTVISIEASPSSNYIFSHWESDNGGAFGNEFEASTSFTMPNEDVTLTACFIHSDEITKITLPESLTLNAGRGRYLNPKLEPGTLEDKAELLNWLSDNSSVATVDQHGYVTTVSAGNTVIRAASKSNPAVTASCNIIVTPAGQKSIQFIYPNVRIDGVGSLKKLEVLVMPEETEADVTFTSSDTRVVTVTSTGMATAMGAGTAEVTAAVDGISAKCTVTVTNIVRSMTIEPRNAKLELGESIELSIGTVVPENASNINELVWESTDESVIKISGNSAGKTVKVVAVGQGSAYVQARIGDVSRVCYIQVTAPKTLAPCLKAEKVKMVSKNSTDAVFELEDPSCYSSGVIYRLYANTENGGTAASGVEVSANSLGFVLHYNYSPTEDITYYVTAQDQNQDESRSIRIKVLKYRPFEVDEITPKIYTGKEIKVKPVVKHNGTPLTEGTDYTLSYTSGDYKDLGTKTIRLDGAGSYSGESQEITYQICLNISGVKFDRIKDQPYKGSEIEPYISGSISYKQPGARKATKTYVYSSSDFDAVYMNNVEIGTASVILIGKGRLTGSVTRNFKITKVKLTNVNASSIGSQYYTGGKITPAVTLTDSNRNVVLEEGKDYKVKYSNNINISKGRKYAVATCTGKGLYTGTRKISFYIYQKDFSDEAEVTVGNANTAVYKNGSKLKPPVTVMLNGKKLKASDYKVTYGDNTGGIGQTGTVTVQGKGNYTGYIQQSFKIVKNSMANVKVTLQSSASYNGIYDGKEQRPGVTVKAGAAELTEGTDFKVEYQNNVNAGKKAEVRVVGLTGEYGGVKTTYFTIKPKEVTDSTEGISLAMDPGFDYTGTAVKPKPVIFDGTLLLEEGKDYKLGYSANTNISNKAKVNVAFMGNYKGKRVQPFEITAWKFDENTVTVTVGRAYFNPKGSKPEVTVKTTSGNQLLKAGKVFKLTYSDNTAAGTGKAVLEPLGAIKSFSGSEKVEKTFKINRVNLSEVKVSPLKAVTFKADSTNKPAIVLKYGGSTLKESTDYRVYLHNNSERGQGIAEICGIGNYVDVISVTYIIK